MAEYLANAVQNVALNSPVLFTASIPCTKGYVYHEDETGIFILRGITNNCFARYKVTFNGNKYKIVGAFDKGKKDGKFKIFQIDGPVMELYSKNFVINTQIRR